MRTQLTLVLAAVVLISGQGCLSGGGSGSGQGAVSQAQTDGDSGGGSAGVPAPPVPEDVKPLGCTDAEGVFHLEGESWARSEVMATVELCPGSTESSMERNETRTMSCHDGRISVVKDEILPALEIAVCPATSLTLELAPKIPLLDSDAKIEMTVKNSASASYTCNEKETGALVKSGSANPAGKSEILFQSQTDLVCKLAGVNASGQVTEARIEVDVDCGNKIKVNGRCEDFTCKSFKTIQASAGGLIEAPARTAEGICYALKIADRISNSNSALTGTVDQDVVSRNHDNGFNNGADTRHPYLMGSLKSDFVIKGPRNVRLAGSADSLAPILVDNFVLRGLYPRGTALVNASYYKAYGTADAAVGSSGAVLLKNEAVPVKAFASGGTSTVSPLDLTSSVLVNKPYTIDLRALDCGGSRELSDLYLVFQ